MPKHLQFSSSQQIKEPYSRLDTHSPPDDEQRNCPLRELDFLLSPFPQSIQEKEKETQEKSAQFSSSQRFREAHSRQDHPSPPDDEQRNRPLRGLDFFLSPFPQSRQEKEKETEEKYLQFSFSQQIKEAYSCQDSSSPTNGEQRKRPPCGGLTFFCLLSPSQDKKRRKRQKKNVPNFHLPNNSEKPIPAKTTLPRVPSQAILIKHSNPRPSGIPALGRFFNPNASA